MTPRRSLGGQAADQIQPAANLERARRVVVLVLDEDVEPGFGGQQRMPHAAASAARRGRRARARRRRLAASGSHDRGDAFCERLAAGYRLRRYALCRPGKPDTTGTMISGRSVISASTPQSSRRRAASSVSTVHTCTPRPARCASLDEPRRHDARAPGQFRHLIAAVGDARHRPAAPRSVERPPHFLARGAGGDRRLERSRPRGARAARTSRGRRDRRASAARTTSTAARGQLRAD